MAAAAAPFSASFVFLASTSPSAGSDFFLFLTRFEMSLVESEIDEFRIRPLIKYSN